MEREYNPAFEELKILLFKNGDTYEDLSNYINRSVGTITNKILGKRKWDWEEMQKIRLHYSLTDEEFMNIFFK